MTVYAKFEKKKIVAITKLMIELDDEEISDDVWEQVEFIKVMCDDSAGDTITLDGETYYNLVELKNYLNKQKEKMEKRENDGRQREFSTKTDVINRPH